MKSWAWYIVEWLERKIAAYVCRWQYTRKPIVLIDFAIELIAYFLLYFQSKWNRMSCDTVIWFRLKSSQNSSQLFECLWNTWKKLMKQLSFVHIESQVDAFVKEKEGISSSKKSFNCLFHWWIAEPTWIAGHYSIELPKETPIAHTCQCGWRKRTQNDIHRMFHYRSQTGEFSTAKCTHTWAANVFSRKTKTVIFVVSFMFALCCKNSLCQTITALISVLRRTESPTYSHKSIHTYVYICFF